MSDLKAYIDGGFSKVEGWVLPAAITALHELSFLCRESKIPGGACEIGVHHGKFFIALLACIDPRYPSLAIDLFENQSLNIDRSGRGSRERFESNLRAWFATESTVTTMAADSLSFSMADLAGIQQKFGRFSFFSVDGGHTVTHALNDMLIAQELTANGGLMIVDDFFQPDWPGVSEAVFKYLAGPNARFAPVCVAGRKLFLTPLSYHRTYIQKLAERLRVGRPRSTVKVVSMHGHNCLSFALHSDDPMLGA